ncbi:MAG: PTS glucose transporter subunit IIA [Eubacteriales bacterium]|nr:PTS glucose transporter subunit IIA [Eubacteriales bacterium]
MLFFKKKKNETTKEEIVTEMKAYVSGKVISITEVKDPVFSSKALGDGIGIEPENENIVAPCAGTISAVMLDSKHAIGMTLNNGAEILIHVGIDTVGMHGEGFEQFVEEGDHVAQGDKLMTFNKALIQSKGLDATCIMAVANADEYPGISFCTGMDAVQNETVICKF